MANYTMPLYQVEEILEARDPAETIFPATYTLFDPNHKDELESKILMHYWLREIGSETINSFLWYFRPAFIESLGIANRKYEEWSKNLEIYKNNTLDITENGTNSVEGNTTSQNTTSNTGNDKNAEMNTPYTQLQSMEDYSTRKSEGEFSNSGTGNSSGSTATESTISRTRTHEGLIGRTESEMRYEYLKHLEDVDNWIIAQLDTCFIQVF